MKISDRYPTLINIIREAHDGKVYYAHDFEHVERVASLAFKISPDHLVGHLAAIAGLCHNADRILQKKYGIGRDGSVRDSEVISLVDSWLERQHLSGEDRDLVHDAVLHHPQINGPNDSPVLTVLMDADRLDIMSAITCFRHGQYMGDDEIAVDHVYLDNDPTATFRRSKSLFKSIDFWLEWADFSNIRVGIRSEKAKPLASRRAHNLRLYKQMVISDLKETGVLET